jgi:abortive infection bacteriophage resistance protein
MRYNRPWLSFQQQLDQLKDRGMSVTDEAAALDYLERIGYYRLSGYWYPFRHFKPEQNAQTGATEVKAQNQFIDNTQFIDAVNLYLFDKKLRLLLTDALERIEVSLRVDIAYLLGERGTFSHTDILQFHPSFVRRIMFGRQTAFNAWLDKYQGLVSRSKEDFVRHYFATHGAELPIWVAVEVFDFGALSQLISMMKIADQQRIADKYGVTDWQVFSSWIFALSYLRNLVAHHSRLWNRNITANPKPPKQASKAWHHAVNNDRGLLAKPFVLLAISMDLLKSVCPNSQLPIRLIEHLQQFPVQFSDKKLTLNSMGLAGNWQDWLTGK